MELKLSYGWSLLAIPCKPQLQSSCCEEQGGENHLKTDLVHLRLECCNVTVTEYAVYLKINIEGNR